VFCSVAQITAEILLTRRVPWWRSGGRGLGWMRAVPEQPLHL